MAIIVTTLPDDIATEMGRDPATLSTIERAQITMWIADATLLINRGIGDAAPDEETVDYVVRQAVKAVAQGPAAGVTSESVQVDDGMLTQRFERGARRITILPEWWSMLGVANGGKAFSVEMAGTRSPHLLWCDLAFGGATCSCGAALAGYPIFEGPSWVL